MAHRLILVVVVILIYICVELEHMEDMLDLLAISSWYYKIDLRGDLPSN